MPDFTGSPDVPRQAASGPREQSRRICEAELELQPAFVKALHVIPPDLPVAEPGDVHDPLRCTLQAGHVGRHHSLARSLPMDHPGEVWAYWSDACQPAGLMAVPDCAERSQDGRDDACLHFKGHAGAHSWALIDPDEDALRTRLGLS